MLFQYWIRKVKWCPFKWAHYFIWKWPPTSDEYAFVTNHTTCKMRVSQHYQPIQWRIVGQCLDDCHGNTNIIFPFCEMKGNYTVVRCILQYVKVWRLSTSKTHKLVATSLFSLWTSYKTTQLGKYEIYKLCVIYSQQLMQYKGLIFGSDCQNSMRNKYTSNVKANFHKWYNGQKSFSFASLIVDLLYNIPDKTQSLRLDNKHL